MQIIITINTDNAAFRDSENSEAATYEVGRILSEYGQALMSLDSDLRYTILRDINGARAGEVNVNG